MNRILKRFDQLKSKNRPGLVTFVTAGDPDFMTCQRILNALPSWGADIVELGIPFSDPMADGPTIQAASGRALAQGGSIEKTLELAASFRSTDTETPLILMGYYNPIYAYGTERFVARAAESGVDGLIVVDLPPEEDSELYGPARKVGLDIIRLMTPTTSEERMDAILKRSSGFIYYVSITGVTGTAKPDPGKIERHLDRIRKKTTLPLAVGFGIKTPDDAVAVGRHADAVVVGSQIVRQVQEADNEIEMITRVSDTVSNLARALHSIESDAA